MGDTVAVIAAGGFSTARPRGRPGLRGLGHRHGHPFLLTRESTVPDAVKKVYLATSVTGTVVTTRVDGAPQRVIRTTLVDHLEGAAARALPRALRNAWPSAADPHLDAGLLAQEGLAMKEGNELTWSQVVMAANAPMMTKAALVDGDPSRYSPHRPGGRRDRRVPVGGRAHRPDHHRGQLHP